MPVTNLVMINIVSSILVYILALISMSNTNVCLVYSFCLCHPLILFSTDSPLNRVRQVQQKVENITFCAELPCVCIEEVIDQFIQISWE